MELRRQEAIPFMWNWLYILDKRITTGKTLSHTEILPRAFRNKNWIVMISEIHISQLNGCKLYLQLTLKYLLPFLELYMK